MDTIQRNDIRELIRNYPSIPEGYSIIKGRDLIISIKEMWIDGYNFVLKNIETCKFYKISWSIEIHDHKVINESCKEVIPTETTITTYVEK